MQQFPNSSCLTWSWPDLQESTAVYLSVRNVQKRRKRARIGVNANATCTKMCTFPVITSPCTNYLSVQKCVRTRVNVAYDDFRPLKDSKLGVADSKSIRL